ncbi:universal stress protein [Natrinema sp. SYSU A 869]|uniref:universal stress protein n=1 Tax=Natrinema sp. SYSU A 869 TaxID=2871694 RepID=UPI001CA3C1F2|nr:universal stress protein [Natrinema sp. SYSU A 869]
MENGLVVVEETSHHAALLREAAQYARGGDAELVVLAFATGEEIGPGVRKIESIGEIEGISDDDGEDAIIDAAETELEKFVQRTLDETAVEYTVAVNVLSEGYGMGTLNAAAEYDCDHVFIAGRKRSPTGKAIFGDWIQRVLLNFDGAVTVSLEEDGGRAADS